MSELDEEMVLHRLLQLAKEATDARYAALAVLDEQRKALARFITLGIDEQTRRRIGEPPTGRGVLGLLIEDPKPLRLSDIASHPNSYGFPAGHPKMTTFLGVPIMIGKQAWGNLYLTDKLGGGEFTEQDEQLVLLIAGWTAVALENARLFKACENRRIELEKAVRGLQAARDVAVAIGGDLSLERALEMIVQRGRALVNARSLVVLLRDGPDLVLSAGAGQRSNVDGRRLPIAGSTSGEILLSGRPQRIVGAMRSLKISPEHAFGVPDPSTALFVPMIHGGKPLGLLVAFDRGQADDGFTDEDEQLLEIFAASAGSAVALAQSAHAEQLSSALAAADAERRRWGRELHDETLQGLGALRFQLSAALRTADPERLESAVRQSISQIEDEIRNLRAIISELRPAALDELGLKAAIETLLDHHRETSGLLIEATLRLPDPEAGEPRLHPELEISVYRLVQEALTNIVKHAEASKVEVRAVHAGGEVSVEVRDDGTGFTPSSGGEGFGLVGMRERVRLAAGSLTITSQPGSGTCVRARLSAPSSDRPRAGSETISFAQAGQS